MNDLLLQNPQKVFLRDQDESAFSLILKPFVLSFSNILAAVFVDDMGECIDYVSRLDPLDTKVIGAQVQLAWREIRSSVSKIGGGKAFELSFSSNQSFFVRQIGHDHALIVVIKGQEPKEIFESIESIVQKLRKEALIKTYYWDDPQNSIQIEVRKAAGWDFAPASVAFPDSSKENITEVFGRWEETASLFGSKLICFKVRTEKNKELTLGLDEDRKKWICLELR